MASLTLSAKYGKGIEPAAGLSCFSPFTQHVETMNKQLSGMVAMFCCDECGARLFCFLLNGAHPFIGGPPLLPPTDQPKRPNNTTRTPGTIHRLYKAIQIALLHS